MLRSSRGIGDIKGHLGAPRDVGGVSGIGGCKGAVGV